LAPVGDINFLDLQIDNWHRQGVTHFTFLLHYQAEQVINYLNERGAVIFRECNFDWIVEKMPMDTGGAIANAVHVKNINGDFLVSNADTWLGGGIPELIQSISPTIATVKISEISRYGQIIFNRSNYVTSFLEKNPQRCSGWINAGLCNLSAELFRVWNGEPFSLERDLFAKLIEGNGLTVVALQTSFIDIGVPSDYYRFCRWIEAGRKTQLCN
jgi:NDP-sugar pyrophosphorylase family protein